MPIRPSSSNRRIVRSDRTTGAILWSQPLDDPALTLRPVSEPVVEPVVAVLPELEYVGPQAEPAPVRRAVELRAHVLPHRLDRVLQFVARTDHPALRGHPGSDPGAQR